MQKTDNPSAPHATELTRRDRGGSASTVATQSENLHVHTNSSSQGTLDTLGHNIGSPVLSRDYATSVAPDPSPLNLEAAISPREKDAVQEDLVQPTWKECFRNVVTYSWLNVMLVFIPVAWVCEFTHQSDTIIFIMSALAIVPCACLLGFATEELAHRLGNTVGGLLNASFGNAIELIVAILALVKGELRVVQSAMLGSILSNCLLVLGCCFVAGGVRYLDQPYSVKPAQLQISMLGLSVCSIVIPASFQIALAYLDSEAGTNLSDQSRADIVKLSRGVAIILLVVYIIYLVFQLFTHKHWYNPDSDDVAEIPEPVNVFRVPTWSTASDHHVPYEPKEKRKPKGPKLTVLAAICLLIASTALAGVTSEFLVDSINGLTETQGISKEWVALILLPLIGNASEHVAAVTVSYKGRLDLSMQIAVGSSVQIALFVLPFLILLGWMIGQPLSLFFDLFETLTLFVSVLIVNFAIQDGSTNYLEGATLVVLYIIIALTFWFYPGSPGL